MLIHIHMSRYKQVEGGNKMKRLVMLFVMIFHMAAVGYAEDNKIDPELLKEHFNRLRWQETVVQVLGSQYNTELIELRKMEAVFCDVCGLSIEKWRAGEYTWDGEKQTFILKQKNEE